MSLILAQSPQVLPVNEMFDSIQGEATHAGTPSTFVRLQGCAVGCPWCDTKGTWKLDAGGKVPVLSMLAKDTVATTVEFADVETPDLVSILEQRVPRAVVITGGEPCNYDLTDLTGDLLLIKSLVQVETSGTQPIRVNPNTWVTLSPKVGMPGGFAVRKDAVGLADEIKWPVGSIRDVAALQDFIREYRPGRHIPIWLQPLSRSPKATTLCIEAATEHGWRVSVQIHAFLGLR